jgi:hypothetical protein
MRHAHVPMPSNCQRWPLTLFDSANSCLPYTSRQSYGHEATHLRGTVSSCVRALAWKSYQSLIVRTIAHPVWDSLRLVAHSRHANVKILLAYFPHLHLSRVLGHHYLAHATAVRPPSHGSAALSAPALVRGIQGSGSGGSSRHNSHVSVSSASLALGRACAHSLI